MKIKGTRIVRAIGKKYLPLARTKERYSNTHTFLIGECPRVLMPPIIACCLRSRNSGCKSATHSSLCCMAKNRHRRSSAHHPLLCLRCLCAPVREENGRGGQRVHMHLFIAVYGNVACLLSACTQGRDAVIL